MLKAYQSITSQQVVLDVAIWLEKHGQAFYEQARDAADDAGIKALFAELAAQEQEHCAIYRALSAQVTGDPVEQEKLFGEYGQFVDMLIREISATLVIEEDLSEPELVDRALRFEKDTLLYFSEMGKVLPGQWRDSLDAICAEEKLHITRLLELRIRMRG